MNFAALALRISKTTERFSLFHKVAQRFYSVFAPASVFQTEAAFNGYQDIFVLKISANDGIRNDHFVTLVLINARYRGLLVTPIPMYASMFRANNERADVLRQFDFTPLRLRVVLFEHKHLINQDRRSAKTMMDHVGYKV